jgi:hypothetical protein
MLSMSAKGRTMAAVKLVSVVAVLFAAMVISGASALESVNEGM